VEVSRAFLAESTAFPVFYATIKIHKEPWATRRIVSCSGSLLYGLRVWVDTQLQKVATAQAAYFKISAVLKEQLMNFDLTPGAKLFKADTLCSDPAEVRRHLQNQYHRLLIRGHNSTKSATVI